MALAIQTEASISDFLIEMLSILHPIGIFFFCANCQIVSNDYISISTDFSNGSSDFKMSFSNHFET